MGGTDGRGTPGARSWLPLRLLVIGLVVALAAVVVWLVRQPERLVLGTYQGLPAGARAEPGETAPGWVLGDDGRLAVYAAGSSSCPWRPTSVTAEGNRVRVRLGQDRERPCTDDLVYTTSLVALPAGVDPDAVDVEIRQVEPAGG
ncbi:hypothetical protein ACQFYA_11960 [Promicromonospora sp. Marseille-Q5078]